MGITKRTEACSTECVVARRCAPFWVKWAISCVSFILRVNRKRMCGAESKRRQFYKRTLSWLPRKYLIMEISGESHWLTKIILSSSKALFSRRMKNFKIWLKCRAKRGSPAFVENIDNKYSLYFHRYDIMEANISLILPQSICLNDMWSVDIHSGCEALCPYHLVITVYTPDKGILRFQAILWRCVANASYHAIMNTGLMQSKLVLSMKSMKYRGLHQRKWRRVMMAAWMKKDALCGRFHSVPINKRRRNTVPTISSI